MAPKTPTDIARWAEARAMASGDRPHPLSRIERAQIIVASKRAGMTLPRLASEFARSDDEIAAVLRDSADTRDVARQLIRSSAAELADRMVADADPVTALDILERVDVVRPKKGGGDTGKLTLILNGITLHGTGHPASEDVVEGDVLDVPLALEGAE